MKTIIPLGILVLLVLSATLLPPVVSSGRQENTGGGAQPAVDPNVVTALDNMGAYLRTLTAFEVEATNSADEVLDTGQKVQFDGTARLQVRRPDKLHAEVKTDRKHREFFYDGKTFTLFGRRVNYYATVPAPPTLRELAIELGARYGIETPLADLFFWGSEDNPPPTCAAPSTLVPARSAARSANSTPCARRAWIGRSGSRRETLPCRENWSSRPPATPPSPSMSPS
jgi:hypothetical protein